MGVKAVLNWLIGKLPASRCSALPANGPSTENTYMYAMIPMRNILKNIIKGLIWCFLRGSIFIPEVLEGIKCNMRINRGLTRDSLFIVWVCLQIYCTNTQAAFFLLFYEPLQKEQGIKILSVFPLCTAPWKNMLFFSSSMFTFCVLLEFYEMDQNTVDLNCEREGKLCIVFHAHTCP